MRVLIIGGAGRVASLIVPELAQTHQLRILDLQPPPAETKNGEYVAGNAGDCDTLRDAITGIDAVLYMAMGALQWKTDAGVVSAFDANVRNVYLTLRAMREAGVGHMVYTSSMSVYRNLRDRFFDSEEIPPDEMELYGLTKRMGEECCRAAVEQWGLSVNALRLCFPESLDDWLAEKPSFHATLATAAPDLTRAVNAALEFRDNFQAFMISGDHEHRHMNMDKAKRLLNWEPLARRAETQSQ